MAKFCSHCGQPTEGEEQKFCMVCGKTLIISASTEATPVTPTVTSPVESAVSVDSNPVEQPKTKKSGSKKFIAVIAIVVVLFGAAFASIQFGLLDSMLTSMTDGGHTEAPITSEEGGVYTVSGGDEIETDLEVVINIGEDTFEDETTLTLMEQPVAVEDYEGIISAYALDVDNEPQGSIEMALPLEADYKESYAVIGIEKEVYSTGTREIDTHLVYKKVPVEDGLAIVELSPEDFVFLDDTTESSWYDGLFTMDVYAKNGKKFRASVSTFGSEYYYSYEDGNFSITSVASNMGLVVSLDDASAKAFLDDLEKVHQYFLDKKYTYHKRDNWPIDVNIISMKALGGFDMSKTAYITGNDPDKAWLSFAQRVFKDGYKSGDQLGLITHEYFHFVQSNYLDHNDALWFDEASAVYFEGQVLNRQPPIITEYWEKAYNGIYPPDGGSDAGKEGYARGPFVKFLANQYGEDIIRQIYLSLESGLSVEEAIETNTLASKKELLIPYYTELASGNLSQEGGYNLYNDIVDNKAPEGLGKALNLEYPDVIDYAVEELMEPIEVGKESIEIKANSAFLMPVKFSDTLQMLMNDNTRLSVECTNAIVPSLVKMKGLTVESYIDTMGIENYETIGAEASDQWSYMLVLVNDSDEVLESNVRVSLKLAPTMDELIGNWANSVVSVEELYIDPAFDAMMTEMMESLGDEMFGSCETEDGEPAEISSIEDIVGQRMNVIMGITKISDTEGKFAYEGETEESLMPEIEALHFSYDKGLLQGEFSDEESQIKMNVSAYYLTTDTVAMTGYIELDYGNGLVIMKIKILGSKGRDQI